MPHKVDLKISIVQKDMTLQAEQCKLPFFLRPGQFKTEALQNITQFFFLLLNEKLSFVTSSHC